MPPFKVQYLQLKKKKTTKKQQNNQTKTKEKNLNILSKAWTIHSCNVSTSGC